VPVIDHLRDPARHGGDPRDAFHVVCMSIPGYGFSGPTLQAGWGPHRIARAFADVMSALGYDRYAAGGGDWGGIIITALARQDKGEHLIALHLTSPAGEQPPPDADVAPLSDADLAGLADWARHQAEGSVVHVPINTTRPHTLAFALNDSPAGLAAWLIDKFRSYSDNDGDIEASFTKDELLAHVTTYWVTGTIGSASRLYYERVQEGIGAPPPPFVTVPTSVAIFPRDVKRAPRPWAERHYDVVRWVEMPAGGHFGAEEEPEAYVDDLREAMRPFRGAPFRADPTPDAGTE
jgi:microsomal epoxide hydrolase